MSKPHLLQVGPLPEWETGPLAQDFTVHRLFEASDRAAFLAETGPVIQAIATRGDLGASADLVAACPHLQIISIFGVGFDAVDLAACRQRGIRVANTPDVLTEDCADLALGMMLAQSRGIVAADRFARDGSWPKGGFPLQRRVWGRRAGVLGLGRIGAEVVLEEGTSEHLGLNDYPTLKMADIGKQCDLGVVIGGDGTMLGIGRQVAPFGLPLIGINQGRLGFITDIPLSEVKATLTAMLGGAYEADRRALMRAKVWRDGHCVFNALALNDVVVNRGATSGMLEVRVAIDGRFVANQRADGVIIATPTGSTAYSLSVGGPLLHPSLPAWVMAPIAPHTLSNRPIVLSDTGEVTIDLVAGRDASANFDMQSLASLLIGDRITVKRSNYHATFLHPRGWSYYDTLRQKLHWNEGVA